MYNIVLHSVLSFPFSYFVFYFPMAVSIDTSVLKTLKYTAYILKIIKQQEVTKWRI